MVKLRIDNTTANIYGYIFVILNAMQGFYIFGFHCINNEKVKQIIYYLQKKKKTKKNCKLDST